VVTLIAILFISRCALDAFNPEKTLWQQIVAFLMHLIPSFVSIIFLIIAWKWEFIGGIIFILLGLGCSPIIFTHNYNMNQSVWRSLIIILVITTPFIIAGILFIVSHRIKNKDLLSLTKNQ
jgi:cytochrome b561